MSSKEIHIATPNGSWELRFPRESWTLEQKKRLPDGTAYYFFFSEPKSGVNLSFFLEPATKCKTSSECREMFWSNPGPGYQGAEGFERFDLNGFSILKCFVPFTVGGIKARQINYSAHLVRDGYWVDMHISKVPAESGDDEVIRSLVSSITFHARL